MAPRKLVGLGSQVLWGGSRIIGPQLPDPPAYAGSGAVIIVAIGIKDSIVVRMRMVVKVRAKFTFK